MKDREKHINIALFVPHAGCPHLCSFCNQKSISGALGQTTPEDIEEAVKTAEKNGDCRNAQIAFFGGSFTAVDRDYMVSLLSKAYSFIEQGRVGSIRISTRPDCIDDEVLAVLKRYGVTSIELGCQSMDDEVLRLNRRGHTAQDVVRASQLIKKHGFELGHQMMTGLYRSDAEKDIDTARKLISLCPDTVRIYPTVILENTELCERYRNDEYKPQSLDEAVSLCSRLLEMFTQAGIPVIRLGLHSGGGVDEGYVAGVYHPAFRELCEGEIYFRRILSELSGTDKAKAEITVSSQYISQALGQKKKNLKRLAELGYDCEFRQDDSYKKYEIKVIPKGKPE